MINTVVATHSQAGQGHMPQQSGEQEEVIDLSQYWRTIKRAKWGIISITLCALIIGGLIASSAIPLYRATAKIMADPQQPNADRDEQYIASALVFLYYETQYEIIQSRNIAQTVVDKLNLVEKYKTEQAILPAKTSGIGDYVADIKKELGALLGHAEKKTPQLATTDADIRWPQVFRPTLKSAAVNKAKLLILVIPPTTPNTPLTLLMPCRRRTFNLAWSRV
jgi:uncharacterized protein involved in exopolysaccharide biosynthesis